MIGTRLFILLQSADSGKIQTMYVAMEMINRPAAAAAAAAADGMTIWVTISLHVFSLKMQDNVILQQSISPEIYTWTPLQMCALCLKCIIVYGCVGI